MSRNDEKEVKKIYEKLIEAWNKRDAEAMKNLFTGTGEIIGFDGSHAQGPKEIFSHLYPIFRDHPTAPFITKVKDIRFLGDDSALLRAIAGMVPPGDSDIKSELNTHHTLVLFYTNNNWQIELLQNTPAQFHGRPELVEEMTYELRDLL